MLACYHYDSDAHDADAYEQSVSGYEAVDAHNRTHRPDASCKAPPSRPTNCSTAKLMCARRVGSGVRSAPVHTGHPERVVDIRGWTPKTPLAFFMNKNT